MSQERDWKWRIWVGTDDAPAMWAARKGSSMRITEAAPGRQCIHWFTKHGEQVQSTTYLLILIQRWKKEIVKPMTVIPLETLSLSFSLLFKETGSKNENLSVYKCASYWGERCSWWEDEEGRKWNTFYGPVKVIKGHLYKFKWLAQMEWFDIRVNIWIPWINYPRDKE